MKKTVIITGASRGIGKSMAKEFAKEGYNVLINYNKSEIEAENLKKEIINFGGIADIYQADVGNYIEAKNLIDYTIEKYNSIDVLINNAGISKISLFTDIREEEWNEIIKTNLTGVFNCTQHAVKHMISKKIGKIINISSIWGITGASCEVHYSTVKAGIIGFTKALAKELAPSNIQVNCIAPGIIMTDMMKDFNIDELNIMKNEIPLERLGTVEDISNVALFLASEKSNYITGQVISPNGGIVI